MTGKVNAPIIILSILIIVFLVSGLGIFNLYRKEHIKTMALEVELEELNTRQRETETKLRESQRMLSDLQFKLEDAKAQIGKLNIDLGEEKRLKVEALGKLEQLRVDLEQQKELRLDLEKRVNQAQDEAKKTVERLKELGEEKKELEAKIKEFEVRSSDVELGKIVVAPEEAVPVPTTPATLTTPPTPTTPATPRAKKLEGKVLVLNKDYNFVVINLGSKDGVSLGDLFSVYHKNKYIGDVKVEKVHDAMSAAGFVSQETKGHVSEGDKVVRK